MAQTIRCIIVEDERRYRTLLRRQLQSTGYPISIEQECDDITDALAAIESCKPDLVFLDILLHGNKKGGFELLEQIKDIKFDVIFTTAYVDDNIGEIRRCGLDRLSKPYLQKEVNEVISKYFTGLDKERLAHRVETLKANLLQTNVQDKIAFISIGNSEVPIKIKDILYFTFQEPTLSWFFYSNNARLRTLARIEELKDIIILHSDKLKPDGYECFEFRQKTTMKKAQDDFKPLQFCSVHKSNLINIHHVVEFASKKVRETEVIMSDGEVLKASEDGRTSFLKMIGKQGANK